MTCPSPHSPSCHTGIFLQCLQLVLVATAARCLVLPLRPPMPPPAARTRGTPGDGHGRAHGAPTGNPKSGIFVYRDALGRERLGAGGGAPGAPARGCQGAHGRAASLGSLSERHGLDGVWVSTVSPLQEKRDNGETHFCSGLSVPLVPPTVSPAPPTALGRSASSRGHAHEHGQQRRPSPPWRTADGDRGRRTGRAQLQHNCIRGPDKERGGPHRPLRARASTPRRPQHITMLWGRKGILTACEWRDSRERTQSPWLSGHAHR